MSSEVDISSYSTYTQGMRRSLIDKIFFMDKIDVGVLVDYGCGDGTVLSFISLLFPEIQCIGYDHSEQMIDLCKKKHGGEGRSLLFTREWSQVIQAIAGKTGAVLLSSVLHEIHSYGTRADILTMWTRLFHTGFHYIAIRDMVSSMDMDRMTDVNDLRKLWTAADLGQVSDFERYWGSIAHNKNFVHFLLKYRYKENWSREVRENYLPLSRQELLSTIPGHYTIDFHEHFTLPYLRKVVKEDFDVDLVDKTHLKLVLRAL